MAEDINDPTNLTELSKQVNPDHVDQNVDLEAVEKQMIGAGGVKTVKAKDPSIAFREYLAEIGKETGIDLMGDYGRELEDNSSASSSSSSSDSDSESGSSSSESSSSSKKKKKGSYDESSDDTSSEGKKFMDKLEKNRKIKDAGSKGIGGISGVNLPNRNSDKKHSDKKHSHKKHHKTSHHKSPDKYESRGVNNGYNYSPNNVGYTGNYGNGYNYGGNNQNFGGNGGYNPQQQFSNVARSYGTNLAVDNFDLEKEKENDMKSILLAEISELKDELKEFGINIKNVPEVNDDDTLPNIQKVHNILEHKYNLQRYHTLGNEGILLVVHGAEWIFDGKRRIGPFQPDLTGWHTRVRPKLRRMKYVISKGASDVMNATGIGNGWKIAFELLPSAFLHSNLKREQHGRDNYSPDAMGDAYDDLRQYDDE